MALGPSTSNNITMRIATNMLKNLPRFLPPLLLAAAIGVCFLLGFGLLTWWTTIVPSPPSGPTVGEPLPATRVTFLNSDSSLYLHEAMTSEDSCSLLVMISTTCPFCLRMRDSWRRDVTQWSDSLGVPVTMLWLAGEDDATLTEFYSGYDFEGVTLLRVADDPARALGRLGLIGTPTTYLLDPHGRLRMGVMGDLLPPIETGREICVS